LLSTSTTEKITELHGQGHIRETGLVRIGTSGFSPVPDTQCASWGFLCGRTFPSGTRR